MRRPVTALRSATIVLVLFATALLGACAASTGKVGVPPAGSSPEAIAILELVNAARATARSCGSKAYAAAAPVSLEARLARAAQLHSEDMEDHSMMSHTGSDGSDLRVRAERQGYDWTRLGENVAAGYTTPAAVMAGWLGSPGHCANIMNPDFTELGVGLDGYYWTQLFGRPG